MGKQAVDPEWFGELTKVNAREHFKWLLPLRGSVDCAANFGAHSSDPIALMWTLDATQLSVIEIEDEHIARVQEEWERLDKINHACLEGRFPSFVTADTSTPIRELLSDHFDLAYCEEVLYIMDADPQRVERAVRQMVRVVKLGGWIIADESRLESVSIHRLLENLGCANVKHYFNSAPVSAHCYRKSPH